MRHYYFFESQRLHRLNLWKRTEKPVDRVTMADHQVLFEGRNVFADSFILRHYNVLSLEPAINKYVRQRVNSEHEVKNLSWHGKRATVKSEQITFPSADSLTELVDGCPFHRSRPWKKHTFFGAWSPVHCGSEIFMYRRS